MYWGKCTHHRFHRQICAGGPRPGEAQGGCATRPYRRAPLTTKSASRAPHFEQTSRAAHSMTVGASPYRSASSSGSGSIRCRAALAPHDQTDVTRSRLAQRQRLRLVLLSPHRYIPSMPAADFTEDERAALAAFLRDSLAADRFPMAPRWRPIKSALAKIDPQPEPPPLPPLKATGEPSMVRRKMRGRRR